MDFNLLLADLRTAAQQYCQKISDKYAATVAYCEVACKTIDKLESIDDYENKVIGLWIILGYIGEMYARLTGPVINALCQKLFRHCARIVLNIQWQQLADDSQSKQNFRTTLETFHAKLSAQNNTRFSLILDLMETGWTHPTLGLVMAEEEDNEAEECLTYIKNEDPVILKIRVEIMIQENCEEFALNLCSWCLKHPALKNDLDIRQTQLMLLHKLNQQDRLQEECQKIPCHDGVRLVSRLQQTETNKALCTELAQTFLIQDWIRPSDHCNSKDLLTLWIRHQYQADRDQEKFLSSVWAVAKLSRSTEQIGLIIDGLRGECGDMFLQLYTDLCIFAINYDKSCLEKHMQEGDMEGLRARQQAMASTCEKLSQLYTSRNPKTAMYAAVTAFALNPSQATLSAVKSFYVNQSLSLVKDRGKQCCTNCVNNSGQCDHAEKGEKINPATFFEVERLLNMLRPYYLNPDHDWLSLGPACDKYLAEREAVSQNYSNEDLINDSSSVSEGSIPDIEQSGMSQSPQMTNAQRTLLHQHLARPLTANMSGYTEQITQVSKHLKPFTAVTTGGNQPSRSQPQDTTSSISSIEPTLQLSDAEIGDKHTLIKQLLFTDLSLADTNTLNELIQQGNIDVMPEAFQEITIDNTNTVSGSGTESQDIPVPIPGHMKHATPVSAADPLFSSLNIPVQEVVTTVSHPQRVQASGIVQHHQTVSKLAIPNHAVKNVQSKISPKPPVKLVPTPATVSSHNVKSGVQSSHQTAGQLNNKLIPHSTQPASNAPLKPAQTKGSVGSAVFHITSGLLRVPSQPAIVPAQQDQTLLIQSQPQNVTPMPVQQVTVGYPGTQVTAQPATQTQYYTNFPQTVSQQIVQSQVPVSLNLIGTPQVTGNVQQLAVPLQQQKPITSNILPTTLSVHPTSSVTHIAPSIAAQLQQSVQSQGQTSVALLNQQVGQTTLSTAFGQQAQQQFSKPQQIQKPQHLGKPQLSGTAQGNRIPKNEYIKTNPTVTANLQQMLKISPKTVVSSQEMRPAEAGNTIYTSTNYPHVAVKTKSQTYPLVKKKSEIAAKTTVHAKPSTTNVTGETDSNVPFVLKSSLSKPKPKPQSKATIFSNTMISTKLSSNTALLGGSGNQSLSCVKPMLTSGSTVCKPGTMPVLNPMKTVSELPVEPKFTASKTETTATSTLPVANFSSSSPTVLSTPEGVQIEKPKKASKKLFNVFYKCKICNELVQTLDDLRKHIQTVCRASDFAPVVTSAESTPDLSKTVKPAQLNHKLTIKSLEACKVFQCPVCKVYCETDPQVLQHRAICLKSRSRPRKKPDKPKPVVGVEKVQVPQSADSTTSPSDSSIVSEVVLNELVQSVEEGMSFLPPSTVPPPPNSTQTAPIPTLPPPTPTPTTTSTPPTPVLPLDLSSLDLTNTEDLKKFIEHFKQQELMKEKTQPSTKAAKKIKKVEVPKAVVSVMSGVVDNVEAASVLSGVNPKDNVKVTTAAVPEGAVPKTSITTSTTISVAPSSPTATTVVATNSPMPSASEQKSVKSKPKVPKPRRLPNPKYKELQHHGMSYFKCFLCKQTFCRKDSLENHWPECYERNGPIRKPKKVLDKPLPTSFAPTSTTVVSVSSTSCEGTPVKSASISVSTVSSTGQDMSPTLVPTTPTVVNTVSDIVHEVQNERPTVSSTSSDGTSSGTNPVENNSIKTQGENTKTPVESKSKISPVESSSKIKGTTPKASPSRPKPPPVPLDSKELAKYDDVIQAVIDFSGSQASENAGADKNREQLNNQNNTVESRAKTVQNGENILPTESNSAAADVDTPMKTKPTPSHGSLPNTEGTLPTAGPSSEDSVPKKKKKPKLTPLVGSEANMEGTLSSTVPTSDDSVPKKKKKPKLSPVSGENNADTVSSEGLSTDGAVSKKKKKKKKSDSEETVGEISNNVQNSASPKTKSKKSIRLPAETVFDITGESDSQPSPKKRGKAIPKKKHVNVKQMLKDRLECILSGKKDKCDVRSDGVNVPLRQSNKGRPKPQILSETKQVIIIVGLEWGCGCSPCGTLFRNHRNLIQHLVIRHLQPYCTKKGGCTTCYLCQQPFTSFISYLNHTPQHSEIILERMDSLIEEKGDIVDIEKSPEKEESEENYVPFPDIQEALNDMLKIRQQQTHGEDGLKLGTESDVSLLSPSSDQGTGFHHGALPTSMSLDSLHEFLPDPSKENVDELAAFARMINDPMLNTDISEQESYVNENQQEKSADEVPVVPVSCVETVQEEVNVPSLVADKTNASNAPEQVLVDSRLSTSETLDTPKPVNGDEMVNKEGNNSVEQLKSAKNSDTLTYTVNEQDLCQNSVEINTESVKEAKAIVENQSGRTEMKGVTEEVKKGETEMEICSEVVSDQQEKAPEVDEGKQNHDLGTDKVVGETVDVKGTGADASSVIDVAEPQVMDTGKEKMQTVVESVIDIKQITDECEREAQLSVKHLRSHPRKVEFLEKSSESATDKKQTVVESVDDIKQITDDCEREAQLSVKHLRSHPQKDEFLEKSKAGGKEVGTENNPDIKLLSRQDDGKTMGEQRGEVLDQSVDEIAKTEDIEEGESKTIVKHLRSHPKKAELVGKKEIEVKCQFKSETQVSKTAVKKKAVHEHESINNRRSKRPLRKTLIKAAQVQAARKRERDSLEHSVLKQDKSSASGRGRMHRRRAENRDNMQPDRGYKLRKTIPAKQFYRSSLKMKARMARSSILDVLHSNRKLNVMRSRSRHAVDSRVERTSTKQTDESKALIKRTAARAHSAKFVTRSSARQIEQRSDNEISKCAQLPESPNKEQNVPMRTRATVKKNKYRLKSFEVRLNNMSAETVRRKSAELAGSSSPAATVGRRSSCDVETKPVNPVSRRVSCDDKAVHLPAVNANPTSPSFLDSFLSYLNNRSEEEDPYIRRKPTRRRTTNEQKSSQNKVLVPPVTNTVVTEADSNQLTAETNSRACEICQASEVCHCDYSVKSNPESSGKQPKNDCEKKIDACCPSVKLCIPQSSKDKVQSQTVESLEQTITDAENVCPPPAPASNDNMDSVVKYEESTKEPNQESARVCLKSERETVKESNSETPNLNCEHDLSKAETDDAHDLSKAGTDDEHDLSKPDPELEEDEVILLEEFKSGSQRNTGDESSMTLNTKQTNEIRTTVGISLQECNVAEAVSSKISNETETTSKPVAEVVCDMKSTSKGKNCDSVTDTSLLAVSTESKNSSCESVTLGDENKGNSKSDDNKKSDVSSDSATPSEMRTDTVAVTSTSSKVPAPDSLEEDMVLGEDKLKGVKSLRGKVKREPFTWDVDDEEDEKLAERNERSLKALRQQVSIAPFTWDLEEDEHGHVITGIEQVQIAPVASCSVTRNTRSGRRRIVKLSTDSRDSGGSTDSDKKEGSIECEATLTTVTWNVEVDDNAVDDPLLAHNTVPNNDMLVTASDIKSAEHKCPIPGVLGRASVVKDGINCIRVVPSNSFKRKLSDTENVEGKAKKQSGTISSGESSSSLESVEFVSDVVEVGNGKSSAKVVVVPTVDNSSAPVTDSGEIQNSGKVTKKPDPKASVKSGATSKDTKQGQTRGSAIMTRKAAKAAAGGQSPSKRPRTSSTSVSNHMPAMVRRSGKAVKYSSKFKTNHRNNQTPRVQVIRVDPVLEGVTTRRTRHGSSERTVHTPVPLESMQHASGTDSDHKWTINKRKNFGYQFSRARRDRKSH